MFQRRGSQLCIILAIAFCVAAKPPPGVGSPWASYAGKPMASRALGPPPISGMGTISVPYMPKSSMFPKFVDPKMMISKKTDLLSNLFGGLGPVDGSGSVGDSSYYSTLGATGTFGKPPSMISANKVPYKRGIFGPMSPFAPVAGKFSPMKSKFPFGSTDTDIYDSADFSSRRKRSLVSSTSSAEMENFLKSISSDPTKETSTKDVDPPPPYPGLAPISEEPEGSEAKKPLLKLFGPPISAGMSGFMPGFAPGPFAPGPFAASPFAPISEEPEGSEAKKPLLKLFGPPISAGMSGFMPGFAPGPFAPGPFAASPFAPVVDPGMFITKKFAFLDTLFKSLATTTPTSIPAVTDAPVPKSTIVPPGFWLPSSVIPGPTEYSQKVSDFLDKLFDSLALNITLNTTTPEDIGAATTKVARSVDDFTTISAAKDAIVDSILSELGDIKGSMVSTLSDLITYEKTVAAATASKKPLKSLKPFKPFAPGLWPTPTVDATLPFQQRMSVLSQVFDMLTELQKNITTAVQETIKAKATSDESDVSNFDAYYSAGGYANLPEPTPIVNTTLLDAIRNKLAGITVPSAGVPFPGYGFAPKVARMVPKTPTSVWVSYPPSGFTSKREVDEVEDYPISENRANRNQYSRAMNMQMHQGYQSMPPGTVETVQVGGGSVPGHQGGGIKLFDSNNYADIGSKWADWADYVKNQYSDNNRHHHNHH